MKRIILLLFPVLIIGAFIFSTSSCTPTNTPAPVHDTIYVHDTTNTHDTASCTNCFGAVACYPFEGNTNDVSGSNYNGTNRGGTLVAGRKGNPNSAYHFDSSTQYIDLPIFNTITGSSNEISISFWSKADNLLRANTVFTLWPDNPNDRLLFHTNYSHAGCGGCNISVFDNGNIYGTGRHIYYQPLSTNWQHYVCIASQTLNRLKVYQDKVLIIDVAGYVAVDRNKKFRLAAPFFGTIDDVKIFNRVLTETDVNSLYNE